MWKLASLNLLDLMAKFSQIKQIVSHSLNHSVLPYGRDSLLIYITFLIFIVIGVYNT